MGDKLAACPATFQVPRKCTYGMNTEENALSVLQQTWMAWQTLILALIPYNSVLQFLKAVANAVGHGWIFS